MASAYGLYSRGAFRLPTVPLLTSSIVRRFRQSRSFSFMASNFAFIASYSRRRHWYVVSPSSFTPLMVTPARASRASSATRARAWASFFSLRRFSTWALTLANALASASLAFCSTAASSFRIFAIIFSRSVSDLLRALFPATTPLHLAVRTSISFLCASPLTFAACSRLFTRSTAVVCFFSSSLFLVARDLFEVVRDLCSVLSTSTSAWKLRTLPSSSSFSTLHFVLCRSSSALVRDLSCIAASWSSCDPGSSSPPGPRCV